MASTLRLKVMKACRTPRTRPELLRLFWKDKSACTGQLGTVLRGEVRFGRLRQEEQEEGPDTYVLTQKGLRHLEKGVIDEQAIEHDLRRLGRGCDG